MKSRRAFFMHRSQVFEGNFNPLVVDLSLKFALFPYCCLAVKTGN